jgi:hypothetical protein
MNRRFILLALILATAACSPQPTPPKSQAALTDGKAHWEQIAAATEMAQVNNGFLIMMR